MSIQPHRTVPFLLQRIATAMNGWHADFRQLGLSVLSVRVLAVLSLNGEASVGELAAATSIDQSTLSHILKRLQQQRLVEKAKRDHDARSVKVELSSKGRAMGRKCFDTAVKHERQLTRGLGSEEIEKLKSTLNALYANVRPEDRTTAKPRARSAASARRRGA